MRTRVSGSREVPVDGSRTGKERRTVVHRGAGVSLHKRPVAATSGGLGARSTREIGRRGSGRRSQLNAGKPMCAADSH